MIAPKSPLPWLTYEDDENGIADYDREQIGDFYDLRDKAYAVHAANVLPEVVAALREVVSVVESEIPWSAPSRMAWRDLRDERLAKARAALAKADAP